MKLKSRLRLKKFLYSILGFLTLMLILFIAWLNNRFEEMCIIIICFYVYRLLYEKQYHARSLFLCSVISIIVFSLASLISMSMSVSILFSIIVSFIITTCSYLFRDLLDEKILINQYRQKLDKLNTKSIDNLTEEDMIAVMPKIRYEVIHLVYGYLHRPFNENCTIYSYKNNISEATMYRYLKLVKETYEDLLK